MVPVWGELDKNQVDDEKVEEAIDRLIEAHNDDANSHLDSGQALQSHKAAEIIDHIVGSVVADKFSHQDYFNFCSFESLDNFTVSGSVALDGWPGVTLTVEDGGDTVSYIESVITYPGGFLTHDSMMVFQFTFWLDSEEDCVFIAFLGTWTSISNFIGFGFYYENGDIKGCWGNVGSYQFTDAFTVDLTKCHVFRSQFDPDTDTVTFYIDGVPVGSLYFATPDDNNEPDLFFSADLSSYDDTFIIYLKNVLISKGQ